MSGIALGVGVASIGAGLYENNHASSAAGDASKEGSLEQLLMEQQALQQYRAAQAKVAPMYDPYLKAGKQATGTLADLMRPGGYLYNAPDMTDFRADPQYQNIKNQALESIRSSRAGAGGLYSGQTDIDLMREASGLADQAYQSIYGRKVGEQGRLASGLSGMSDMGKWATTGLANLYTGTAGNVASTYGNMGNTMSQGTIGEGNARASGIMGQNSTIQSGLGMGLNAYNAYQMNKNYQDLLKRLTPQQPQNVSNYGNFGGSTGSGYGGYANPGSLPTGNW